MTFLFHNALPYPSTPIPLLSLPSFPISLIIKTAQLAPLKAELSKVSEDEWMNIPETGDHSLKYKKKSEKQDLHYTPLPDSMIDSARMNLTNANQSNSIGGFVTPMSGASSSMVGLAGARGTVLQLKLDKMGDSVTGQTVIDPKGYLTDLNSVKLMNDTDVSDAKKARALLKSVIDTNPNHAPGKVLVCKILKRMCIH